MGKIKDITGMVFGYWTVLERSEKTNRAGQQYWKSRCICGTEKEVSGTSLRTGQSISCGCRQREAVSKNIVGQKFGKLTAIERTDKRDRKAGYYWHCVCDCGNHIDVPISRLSTGTVRSCGCAKNPTKDLTGMKFNMLTAIRPTDKRSGSAIVWECMCDCGNRCNVSLANLQNGHTKSCGCLTSVGEQKVSALLSEYGIPHEKQKRFDTCRFPDTNMMARFDFYINGTYLLEYDGYQHFNYLENSWITEDVLYGNQMRDRIKDKWCKENEIPLIRIPYTHLENLCIDDLVLETSQFVVS